MGNFFRERSTQDQQKRVDQKLVKRLKNNNINQLYDAISYANDFYPSNISFKHVDFEDTFGSLFGDFTDQVFKILKNQHNEVDLYETVAILALINGDDYDKRIELIFLLFDFDNSGQLEQKEFIMSCKSVLYGICKLAALPLPPIQHIEQYALIKYAVLDKDLSGTLSVQEIQFFLREDFEIQDSFAKYTNVITFENVKRRYKEYLFQFNTLYKEVKRDNNGLLKEFKILLQKNYNYKLVSKQDLDYFIDTLETITVIMDPQNKQGIIFDKAFNLVISIWSGFSACDIDSSNSIDEHELKYLLYCHDERKPSSERVRLEMENINVAKSGNISRKEMIDYICKDVIGLQIFNMNLYDFFAKYDKDGSGQLSQQELQAMMEDMWRPLVQRYIEKGQMQELDYKGIISGSLAEFMAALDKDKNNNLEWKEFKEFLKVFYHREDKFRKFILALYEPKRLK